MNTLNPVILCVDDEPGNLKLLERTLGTCGYLVLKAGDGREALDIIARHTVDLVLTDVMMPGIDGFEICRRIKGDERYRHIPVVMITALDSKTDRIHGIEAGVDEFLSKPFDHAEVLARVKMLLRTKQLDEMLDDDAFAYTVHSLARASEANDEDTGDHILRVGEYCAIVAERLGLAEQWVQSIKLQATLHDVGKVHIPSYILKKPGGLTPEEWKIMRRHPEMGAKIIGDNLKFHVAKQISLTHHERWDGGGYPLGLAGERIPLEGRIMNIADQYDALRNARVYKPAFDHATSVRIITEGDGRTMPHHFDPQVLRTFVETDSLFEEVYEKFAANSSLIQQESNFSATPSSVGILPAFQAGVALE
ncbi:MAG: response regulator [Steroidobacteraceae bacterium]|nr:response regulator [Deltaproteobacteria bacterium]